MFIAQLVVEIAIVDGIRSNTGGDSYGTGVNKGIYKPIHPTDQATAVRRQKSPHCCLYPTGGRTTNVTSAQEYNIMCVTSFCWRGFHLSCYLLIVILVAMIAADDDSSGAMNIPVAGGDGDFLMVM